MALHYYCTKEWGVRSNSLRKLAISFQIICDKNFYRLIFKSKLEAVAKNSILVSVASLLYAYMMAEAFCYLCCDLWGKSVKGTPQNVTSIHVSLKAFLEQHNCIVVLKVMFLMTLKSSSLLGFLFWRMVCNMPCSKGGYKEIVQCFRLLVVHAEPQLGYQYPCHGHPTACNFSSKHCSALCWLMRALTLIWTHPHAHAHTYMHAYI